MRTNEESLDALSFWGKFCSYYYRTHQGWIPIDAGTSFSRCMSKLSRIGEIKAARTKEAVSANFLRWQLASVLLAISFIPYTIFYWQMVVNASDSRHLAAALIFHIDWFASWAVITIPLFRSMSMWRRFKARMIADSIGSQISDPLLKAFDAVEPIGEWTKAISAALTALSFIAPFAKAILSR